MIIDLNGPDIDAVDEVRVLILESVNVWKNFLGEDTVKEQCRCNPTDQEHTGQK